MGFHRWTHIYNKKYRGFHPRGYLFLLVITRYKFSCSTNSGTPLNFVQRYSTHSSTTKDGVLWHHALIPMNAMSQCICNALGHCISNPCLICNECHMANKSCIMDNYIENIQFPNISSNCNILKHIYQQEQPSVFDECPKHSCHTRVFTSF